MSDTTWLTQESFDRLKAEYEQLTTKGRAEIASKIEAAREEGDLKENGGYHAAREEQSKQEARIRQLENILRTAHVGEAPADDGIVEPGMVVTADIAGKEMTFLLGSREIGDLDLKIFTASSPLGEAIIGKSVGDKTSYTAPTGKEIPVKIKKASPYVG